jgi:hypothetical protein
MTDTDTTSEAAASTNAHAIHRDAGDSAPGDQAAEGQQDIQAQPDPDSDGQLQRETDQQERESEEEHLARLDMETENDKANMPLDTAAWGSTGHAVADEALRTLQNVGLSTDDAVELLLDAAMSRDPSKVDQKALVAKIGPRRAKAIMKGLETFSRDMRPRDERISNEVYQYTNGRHALQRLLEKAGDMLPPSEVQGYISEMGKGGSSAQRAVENLKARLSGEAIPLDRRVHTDHRAAPRPAAPLKAASGITSKAYVAGLEALHAPGSRLSFEARDRREAELREARRIGRETGLR